MPTGLLNCLGEHSARPTANAKQEPVISLYFNAHILLAEDNPINRQVAVQMPEMDGLTAVQMIREWEADAGSRTLCQSPVFILQHAVCIGEY